MFRSILLALAVTVAGTSGCDRTEGDECAVDEDCREGLVCLEEPCLLPPCRFRCLPPEDGG
jgi:hypothetical protein